MAFRAGIRDADFWTLTPHETQQFIDASGEGVVDRRLALVTASWLTAYYGRVKKLPPLKGELKRHTPKREQSPAEQMDKARAIQRLFGGVMQSNG